LYPPATVADARANEIKHLAASGGWHEGCAVSGVPDNEMHTVFMFARKTSRAVAAAGAAVSATGAAPAPLDLAALVGAAGWQRLPGAVRRRFAAGHAPVVYEGRMDLACSGVGRLFAALSAVFGGPLTGLRADAVPTRVRVLPDGRGGVIWQRHFLRRGAADRVVQSTKQLRDGGLVERTVGGLAMRLAVFEARGALVFESRRYFFDLFGHALPLPAWLSPGTCRVEHRDAGAGRFRFTLTMDHPWWGRTFHQTGVFLDPVVDSDDEAHAADDRSAA